MKNLDISTLIINGIFAVFFLFFPGITDKYKSTAWRIVYIVPFLLDLIMLGVGGYEKCMLPVYIGAVLASYGFFFDKKRVKQLMAVLFVMALMITIPICQNSKLYRGKKYHYYFEEMTNEMQKHYILADYKNIDLDALIDKYDPAFREAQKKNDGILYYESMIKFIAEFPDGHVYFYPIDRENEDYVQACDNILGNDYGLSLVKLDQGGYAAADVASGGDASKSLKESGIHNGTIITSWGGKSIEDYRDDITLIEYNMPIKENYDFMLPLYVAGKGKDTVDVTYLNDKGEEEKVTLTAMGPYYDRFSDMQDKLFDGIEAGNLAVHDIDEDTAVIRIKMMMFDSESANKGEYSAMQQELETKVKELKEAGKSNLILDMRRNEGGDPYMIKSIFAVFAPKGEHEQLYTAKYDEKKNGYVFDEKGRMIPNEKITYQGEDMWHDGKIYLLVNAECISAGDHTVYEMSQYPNVTVIGLTQSNGSGQAVSQHMTEAADYYSFSEYPVLNEDGSFLVDADANGLVSQRLSLDVKIPMDQDGVEKICNPDEDYELDYTVKYAEENQ